MRSSISSGRGAGRDISGDLRDEAFCRRLVDEAVRGLGGIDILVMNAGRQQTRVSRSSTYRATTLTQR